VWHLGGACLSTHYFRGFLQLLGSTGLAVGGGESRLRSTSQGDAWQREEGEQAVTVVWDFQTGLAPRIMVGHSLSIKQEGLSDN